jgi:hypothetical protein
MDVLSWLERYVGKVCVVFPKVMAFEATKSQQKDLACFRHLLKKSIHVHDSFITVHKAGHMMARCGTSTIDSECTVLYVP